jgi:hypothetical protein
MRCCLIVLFNIFHRLSLGGIFFSSKLKIFIKVTICKDDNDDFLRTKGTAAYSIPNCLHFVIHNNKSGDAERVEKKIKASHSCF